MALREALEAAVNTAEGVETPVTPAVETPVVETTAAETPKETETQKSSGRTEGRARDEHGRLLPGKAEKKDATPAPQTTQTTQATRVETTPTPSVQRPPRPSSWKKEMWEHYDKFDPKVAEYIHQREAEFAKGVSTYKADFDRARPLLDAVSQYEPFLKQQNLTPEKAVSALFQTDQTLRFGNPQQRLQTFARLAQDYQIPIHEMLVQGEDGKVYFNQQYFQPQTQQASQPQGLTMADAEKLFQEKLSNMQWTSAIQNFAAAKDDKGNPKYPHFQDEKVRQTMDGLLRAKLAPDLETAYAKSLRMHDDIWEQDQKSRQDAALKASQEAQARQVGKAKSAAVSVKSATPASEVSAKGKGIRSHLESATEAHEAVGRV